jgi:hypothetical protein
VYGLERSEASMPRITGVMVERLGSHVDDVVEQAGEGVGRGV